MKNLTKMKGIITGRCLNCSELFNYTALYKKGGKVSILPQNTEDDGGWDDDHSTIGVE